MLNLGNTENLKASCWVNETGHLKLVLVSIYVLTHSLLQNLPCTYIPDDWQLCWTLMRLACAGSRGTQGKCSLINVIRGLSRETFSDHWWPQRPPWTPNEALNTQHKHDRWIWTAICGVCQCMHCYIWILKASNSRDFSVNNISSWSEDIEGHKVHWSK